MNLLSCASELTGHLKKLRQLWEETREYWNDPVSQAFEKDQWAPLEHRVTVALQAMDRISPLLDQMRRDCE